MLLRYFLIGLMIASKVYDDSFATNDFYAQVGGISLELLNKLEMEFLILIDFQSLIQWREYEKFSFQIIRTASNIHAETSTKWGGTPLSSPKSDF